MSLYLNVPFSEKDEAKSLGARWNPEKKKWFLRDKNQYSKFAKWILDNDEEYCTILCDFFYIVEGKHTCFKCGKQTSVIGFGVENYFNIYRENNSIKSYYNNGEINISSTLEPLPENLIRFLKEKYKYYSSYSKTTDSVYPANHCCNCGIIQGNFFIFEEVDSPFFIHNEESASNLNLYRIKLSEDFKVFAEIGYGSEDYLIKSHAKIRDLEGI